MTLKLINEPKINDEV